MNKYKYKYYLKTIKNINDDENILDIMNIVSEGIDQIYNNYTKITDNELETCIEIYKFEYNNDYHITCTIGSYIDEMYLTKRDTYYVLTKAYEYTFNYIGFGINYYFKSFERLCDYLDYQFLKD